MQIPAVEAPLYPALRSSPSAFLGRASLHRDLAHLLIALPHRPELATSLLAWRPSRLTGRTVTAREEALFAIETMIEAAQDAVREAKAATDPHWLGAIAAIARSELLPRIETLEAMGEAGVAS